MPEDASTADALLEPITNFHILMSPLQFPELYKERALQMVHHSTAKLDELVTKLLNFFNDHFVPGEEAVGSVEGHLMPCKVLRAVDEQGDDVDLDAGKLGQPPDPKVSCQACALQSPASCGRPGALQTGMQAGTCFPSGSVGHR